MAAVEQNMETDEIQEVVKEEKAKSRKPGECRTYLRKTLAEEFEGIVAGFVAAAKEGSCQHLKLATELLQPVRKGTSRAKGPVAKYWEKLEKERLEADRAENQL